MGRVVVERSIDLALGSCDPANEHWYRCHFFLQVRLSLSRAGRSKGVLLTLIDLRRKLYHLTGVS